MVKSRIVRLGNSQGVRIPTLLLEPAGLGDEVDAARSVSREMFAP